MSFNLKVLTSLTFLYKQNIHTLFLNIKKYVYSTQNS
jgi:hypothetical protein